MFKAYVFDLDGTLINSISAISTCFNSTLKSINFNSIEEDLFNYFVGDGPKVLVDRAFDYLRERDNLQYSSEELEIIKDKFLLAYLYSYNKMEDNYSEVYTGIKESLDHLKANGKKLVVCTNKPIQAAKNVVFLNFGENYFDYIVGLEEENNKKPNPFMMNKVMRYLNVTNDQIAYFGDTSTDMLTAKNVDIYAVGVLWGFRDKAELLKFGADKIISNPSEIKDI